MTDSQTKHEHHDHSQMEHDQHTSAKSAEVDPHASHAHHTVKSQHDMQADHSAHGMDKTDEHAEHVDHTGHEDLFRLSRASYSKMIQNLVWASGYNVVALPLAAGVLAGAGILLSLAIGALLMSLSTVIVAINAQLLRRLDLSN